MKIDLPLTQLLEQARTGDRDAVDALIKAVYPDLRKIAAKRLRRERADHTLQPMALVNEVYLRLFGAAQISWQNRAHFFAIAAKQMRFILVDHARRKRGDGHLSISIEGNALENAPELARQVNTDLLALDEALSRLEAIDERAAHGLEMRFFVGLTQQEIAEIQQIDVATVRRDWVFAKSWLYSQLHLTSSESNK